MPERKISKRRTRVGTLTPRKPKNGSNAELSVMQQNVEEINVSYDDVLKSINKKIAYHNNIVGDKKVLNMIRIEQSLSDAFECT